MENKKEDTIKLFLIIFAIAFVIAIGINRIFLEESKIIEIKNQVESYRQDLEKYKKIEEELKEQKEKSSTDEYVEKTARKKLDMFLPNERVYIYEK